MGLRKGLLFHISHLSLKMVCRHVCEWLQWYYLIFSLMIVKLHVVLAVTEPDLSISISYALGGKWSEVDYKMMYGRYDGSDRDSLWEHQVKINDNGWELNVAFKAWTEQAANLSANSNATFKCFHACHRMLPSYSRLLWSAWNNLGIDRIKENCDSFHVNEFCVTADWPGAEQFVLGYFERGGMEKREDMTMVLACADPMFPGGDAQNIGDHFGTPRPIQYMFGQSHQNNENALNASFNRWEIFDTFFAERLGGTTCFGGYELDNATGKCQECQINSWRDIFQRNENLKCTSCQNHSGNFAPGGVGAPQCVCDAGYKEQGPSRRRRGVKVCVPCPVGHFAPARFIKDMAAEECRPCESGYFSNESGSKKCSPCAAGSFAAEGGASACEFCPPGRIAYLPGSVTCSQCSRGTAMSVDGATACVRCDIGRFAPAIGMSNCTECDEGLSTAALGAAVATECICPRGTFLTRFVPTMMCSECFDGMICEADSVSWDLLGAAAFNGREPKHPQLEPGFMVRMGDIDVMVYKCKDTEVCPGGDIGLCGLGRDPESVACAKCPSRFYISLNDQCEQCLGEHATMASIVQVVTLAALMHVGVALLMAKQSRQQGVYHESQTMALFNDVFNVIKQLVNQLQVMGAFSSIRIDWPVTVKVIISTWTKWSTYLMDFGQFGLSCALPDFALRWVFECLLLFCIPLSGVALFVIAHAMRWVRAGSKNWVTPPKIVTVTGFFCMLFYISASRKAIAPLECYSHPARTGQASMTQHASVICGQGDHGWMLALGLFFCLLYPVGILAWFLSICYMAPARFARTSYLARGSNPVYIHRFLFRDFRFECYWWAPVSMVRDLMLACTCSIVPSHPVYQLQLDVLWLLVYLMLCTFFWPYSDSGQSFLDMARIGCALILLACAGYFAGLSSDAEVDSTQVIEINMAISFFVCWLIGGGLVLLSIAQRLRPSYWEKANIELEQGIVEAVVLLDSVINEMPLFFEGISAQNARKLQLILHRGLRKTSVSRQVPYCRGATLCLAADMSVEGGVSEPASMPEKDKADHEYVIADDQDAAVVQIHRSRLQL